MEFPAYFDTCQLFEIADTFADIVAHADGFDAEDVAEAKDGLVTMRSAQQSLGLYGIQSYEDEDIAENWNHIENEISNTLVRDDEVAEWIEQSTVENGYMTQEAVNLIRGAMDWYKFAESQPHSTIVFPNPDGLDGSVTYWIS